MNHPPPSISFITFFFIELLFFIHLPVSYTQDAASFARCFDAFPCGNIPNLVFPFWKEDSPEFCRNEGFGLTECEDDHRPVINIGDMDFRLIFVNQTGSRMTIARHDLWEKICPPPPISNITLGSPFLQFSPTNRNLTFFYGCNSSVAPPRGGATTECTSGSGVFYADDIVDGGSYARFRQFCGVGAIQVPINQSHFEQLPREGPASFVSGEWRVGFDVEYNYGEIFCGKCNGNRSLCDGLRSSEYPICEMPAMATETLSADSHFEACKPRSCGNGPDISYPFWIFEEHASFCGYPNFKITCKKKDPILKISEESYIIRDIFYNNNSLLVVDAVLHEEDCPIPLRNVSVDRTPFSLSLDNVNLSFLYDCERQPKYHTYPVSCASNTSVSSFAVFHKEALENTNYSIKLCRTLIESPVYVNNDVSFVSLLGMNYTEVLKLGFILNWTAHSCSNCKRSGGRCGFGHTHEFVCFCSDGPHPKTCNNGSGFSLERKLIIGFSAAAGGILISCAIFYFLLRRHHGKGFYKSSFLTSRNSLDGSSVVDPEKSGSFAGVHVFTYNELEEATNNFDSDRELGDGGFGTVYYGELRDGRAVAVKRLYENNYKRVEQFMNEVNILTQLRHQNLVSLYGSTSRHSRELLLVYEYVPNGTVADHLHGDRAKPGALSWNIRLEIAIETANALRYLHASDIIHRDVKTNNILLDKDFRVKVADFGLSRLFPTDVTHVSTAPQGTPGYVDPDYHLCYQLTSKSDVFSFGVVLIELISSKPAVDITRHRHEINLWNMAINKIQMGALHELVDPSLGFESNDKVKKTLTGAAEVAFQCLQHEKDMRPTMTQVWESLMGIQNEDYKKVKDEEMDLFGAEEEGGLLKSEPLPRSPDSVMMKWVSNGSSTTTTTPSF